MKLAGRHAALLLCLLASGWMPNTDTITVTSLSSSGPGSLREAILEANARRGPNDIVFDIQSNPQTQGWWVITLESALPFLTDSGTRIKGSTQGGAGLPQQGTGGTVGADRLPLNKFPAPLIVINANGFDGLTIASNVSDIVVEGLSIVNARNGIVALGSSVSGRVAGTKRKVRHVFVGVLPNGLAPGIRMNTGHGIVVRTSSPDLPTVELDVAESFIAYNGGSGITGEFPSSTVRITRSEIAHNGWQTDLHDGIDLNGRENRVTQNLIRDNRNESGTNQAGSGNGIEVGSRNVHSDHNLIVSNTIIDNHGSGISIVGGSSGNLVHLNEIRRNRAGIDLRDPRTRSNLLKENQIFENEGLGIDLKSEISAVTYKNEHSDGESGDVTLNGISEVAVGPNLLTTYPFIERAVVADDTLRISGFAEAGAGIEVFESDEDVSGFGEGRRWLFTVTEGSNTDLREDRGAYGPLDAHGREVAYRKVFANRFEFEIALKTDILSKTTSDRPQYLTGTSTVWDTLFAQTLSTPGFNTSEFGPNIEVAYLPDRVKTIRPEDGAADLTAPVLFSWEPAAYAEAYVLEIFPPAADNGPDFLSIVLRDTVDGTQFRTRDLEADSRYYWRVRGLNDKGRGAWSDVRLFATGAHFLRPGPVRLEFPKKGLVAVETNVLFQWRKTTLADTYEIEIARDSAFSPAALVDRAVTSDYTHRSTHLANGAAHYWRVRATNANGPGPWSATWHFTTVSESGLGPVTLLLPDSTASFTNVETLFRWVPVDGAVGYQIEVSTDDRFEDDIVDAGLVGGTFYRSFHLRANTAYYWRVVARSSKGLGVWSNVWSFSTSPDGSSSKDILLLSPDSGAVLIEVEPPAELTWRRSMCANVYDVEIATSSDFAAGSIVDYEVVEDPRYVSDALSLDKTYWWRVFGRGANCLETSSKWQFSTGTCLGPDRVFLASPNPGETVSVVTTFTWEDQGEVRYEIEISSDSTFKDRSISKTAVTRDTEWSGFSLLPAQRYYWRVRAFNDCGIGDWSTVRRFTTKDEPPPPEPPVLVSPTDGEENVPTIPILVLRSAGPIESFRVQLSDDETFVRTVIDTVVSTPRLGISSPLKNGTTYYWRAQAGSPAGISIWSPTSRFKTALFKARFNDAVRENRLAQNRPNPFNPSTTIEFELKDASHVSLFIFDIQGRKVATLVEAQFGEGVYEVVWDGRYAGGTPAPSGLYLYRIVADEFTVTKRMVLIK